MQPKAPPTPNIQKLHKSYPMCPNHPEKKANYCLQTTPKQRFCVKCALTIGRSVFVDNEKLTKKEGIEQFRNKIKHLKQTVQRTQQNLSNTLYESECQMQKQRTQLAESFKDLIKQIQQKHEQLESKLTECHNKMCKSVRDNVNMLSNIHKSAERYLYDVNYNYDDIINELQLQHFKEIMHQYDDKIQYFHIQINEIQRESVNTVCKYVPFNEIRKVLDKATINNLQITPKSLNCKKRVPSNLKQNCSIESNKIKNNKTIKF